MFQDIIDEVKGKTSVEDAVKALIRGLALDFKVKAEDGMEAVDEYADALVEHADEFGAAVMENVELPQAPAPAGGDTLKAPVVTGDEEVPTPKPANDTTRHVLEHTDLDVATANSMTGPGSNT